MKEISRRVMDNFDERFNPEEGIQFLSGIECIDAEITLEDEGRTVYVLGEWVSECPEDLAISVTDESIYDLSEQFNYNSDLADELISKRDEIEKRNANKFTYSNQNERYAKYISEIEKMIIEYGRQNEIIIELEK